LKQDETLLPAKKALMAEHEIRNQLVFKQLGNIASLLKQAQQMSGKMQEISSQLRGQRVEGVSGGGMIKVEANGLGEVLKVRIDPELLARGDGEMIEDLLPAAINDASAKAKALHAEAMKSMTADMNVPGLSDALEKIVEGKGGA
jgi:DNA-binding YbaB/EbfC family protein